MLDEISSSHMTTYLQSQPLREFCVAEEGHLCVGLSQTTVLVVHLCKDEEFGFHKQTQERQALVEDNLY